MTKLKPFKFNLLFKASFYNFIIMGIKVICGLVLSKATALFLGPSGLALLGNLNNLSRMASGVTAEGYQNGTVRYVSEFHTKPKTKKVLLATVFQLSLGVSLVLALFFWGFSKTISLYLFDTYEYALAVICLGIGLPFLSINLIVIFILNGEENYKKLVVVNGILSLVSMLIAVIVMFKYDLYTVMISVGLIPIVVFGFNYICLREQRYIFKYIFEFRYFSISVLKKMSAYFTMAVYSAIIVSVNLILVRNLIIEKLSIDEAGYWEAMNKISSFYVMFFLSLTSFYLLPQFSKINSVDAFKIKITNFYKLCIPLLLVSFTGVYFMRFVLLEVFLSKDFLPTSSLFLYRLIGDFISVLSIALVKQFHAKLMIKAYIICNGALNVLYFCLSYCFIDRYGLNGVMKAYALSYLLYFILVLIFILTYFKRNYK